MQRSAQIWLNCAVTAALEEPQGQVQPEVIGKNTVDRIPGKIRSPLGPNPLNW